MNTIALFLFLFILLGLGMNSKFYNKDVAYSTNEPIKNKVCVSEDPCFLYENTNRTQTIYLKLVNSLQKISNTNKVKLENCKQDIFIQGTTDNRLKTELDEITNRILKTINLHTGFYFIKVYYDTITLLTDQSGNKNFKYNVFIYDPNEELDIRLYVDVIKYIVNCPKKNKKITCASVSNTGMNDFEIGYPQPEQLLPLPTQIINTSGAPDVLSNDGINIKEIPPIKSLHINEVSVYNTNTVINANGKCVMPPVCGNIKDTTLSSSLYNGITTPFQEPACVRNKWIRLKDEPKCLKNWPAGTQSPYWNEQGIPTPKTCNSQEMGLRSSTTQIPLEPQFWRSNYVIPKWSGPNNWMFSLTRGDTATEGADFS